VITAHGTTDQTTTEYLSKRLGLTEVSRITAQHSQSTSDSEAPVTHGQILKAFADREAFAGAFGPSSKNKTQGSFLNHGEQLHKIDLMTSDEIGRYFAREKNTILTLIAGALPIRLMRLSAHKDEFFKTRAAPNPFHRKPKKGGLK
jgi:type IV secretory pathway TraG/TraD family ATPase VirD4